MYVCYRLPMLTSRRSTRRVVSAKICSSVSIRLKFVFPHCATAAKIFRCSAGIFSPAILPAIEGGDRLRAQCAGGHAPSQLAGQREGARSRD